MLLKGGAMKQNKWKCLVLFFMAAVILFLCSCGGDDYYPPTPGSIELNNYSDATIDGFYLAPIYQTSWGPNLLGDVLYPDEYALFLDIYPDDYDAKIRTIGQFSDYFSYVYDIPIYAGDRIVLNVYNDSFSGSLQIINITLGANIIRVYVVPAGATTWGDNQTSSDIGPSGVLHLSDLYPGLYDVMIVWNIGDNSFYYDISVDSLTLTTINAD